MDPVTRSYNVEGGTVEFGDGSLGIDATQDSEEIILSGHRPSFNTRSLLIIHSPSPDKVVIVWIWNLTRRIVQSLVENATRPRCSGTKLVTRSDVTHRRIVAMDKFSHVAQACCLYYMSETDWLHDAETGKAAKQSQHGMFPMLAGCKTPNLTVLVAGNRGQLPAESSRHNDI